jgi:hypothetical protein
MVPGSMPDSGKGWLFDLAQEVAFVDRRVPECDAEGLPIDLVVKRNDNLAAIGVDQFHVATFAMRFMEPEPSERRDDLPTRQQRQTHKVKSTTSHPTISSSRTGSGSR